MHGKWRHAIQAGPATDRRLTNKCRSEAGQLDRYISGVHREASSATLGNRGGEGQLLGICKVSPACGLIQEHVALSQAEVICVCSFESLCTYRLSKGIDRLAVQSPGKAGSASDCHYRGARQEREKCENNMVHSTVVPSKTNLCFINHFVFFKPFRQTCVQNITVYLTAGV